MPVSKKRIRKRQENLNRREAEGQVSKDLFWRLLEDIEELPDHDDLRALMGSQGELNEVPTVHFETTKGDVYARASHRGLRPDRLVLCCATMEEDGLKGIGCLEISLASAKGNGELVGEALIMFPWEEGGQPEEIHRLGTEHDPREVLSFGVVSFRKRRQA